MPDTRLDSTGSPNVGLPAAVDVAADGVETPVFVDVTGARHRRTRALLVAASVLCLGFVGLVVLGLSGSGALSGSPILSPLRSALDDLGVPRPDTSSSTGSPSSGATPSSSLSPSASPTAGILSVPRPTTGAGTVPSATGTRATTTGPRPTTTPTPSSTAPSAANPGSTRRATPTPKATAPSPTPKPSTSTTPPR